MKRRRREIEPLSDINVTNLLDTAFVLLMAFMIVAPSIKHGIELELPTVDAGTKTMDKKKTVTIAIQKKISEGGTERIFVEDARLTPKELTELLVKRKQTFPEMDVIIECDKSVSYETFAQAVGAVKEAGIEDIGLPTLPPTQETAKVK